MNPFKLIGWAGLAIAIITAFVTFEYAGLLLVLLGLAAGFAIATEDSVRVIVTAIALSMLSNVLMHIPEVGEYLTRIFSSLGIFAAGAALTIITRNIWNRYKP